MTVFVHTEERCNFIYCYSGPLQSLSANYMTQLLCYFMYAS